ncbi:MAG: D-2-hydroxyacid dehydrogenase family protein, partial [Chloroflexi bacterium]
MRIALINDYQDVARTAADWASLPAGTEVVAFHDHVEDEDTLVERLRDFDVVVGVRQRVQFRRSLLEQLPNLKLLMNGGG